MFIV
jgi:hypothetical protein